MSSRSLRNYAADASLFSKIPKKCFFVTTYTVVLPSRFFQCHNNELKLEIKRDSCYIIL